MKPTSRTGARSGSGSGARSASRSGGADPRIPEKQNFRIGEVAEIADVEAHTLRFWESEFEGLAPAKSKTGQRTYTRKDVEYVLVVRDLLYEEGFTIPGAKRQLAKGVSAVKRDRDEVPARTKALLDRVRNEVEELLQLCD